MPLKNPGGYYVKPVPDADDGVLLSNSSKSGQEVIAPLSGLGTAIAAGNAGTTIFNADGSMTAIRADGVIVTTTFGADGSVATAYGAPVNKTKTTTFNADGSITEVWA